MPKYTQGSSGLGVSKLQSVGQIQHAACFVNKVLFKHSHPYSFISVSSLATLQQQSRRVVTEIVWPKKLKIFILHPFTDSLQIAALI